MKVIALVQDPQGIARYLRHLGLPTEKPSMAVPSGPWAYPPCPTRASRAPVAARGPPFWQSRVLRRRYGEPPNGTQA